VKIKPTSIFGICIEVHVICCSGNNNKMSGNINHILPQPLTSRTGFFMTCMRFSPNVGGMVPWRVTCGKGSDDQVSKAFKSQISN